METVNLIYHYKGRWVHIPKLAYIEGDSKLLEKVDLDYLSFTHMLKMYKEEFGEPGVKKLCYLKPGVIIENGELAVIENDDGIKKMTEFIKSMNPNDSLRIYPVNDDSGPTHVDTGCSSFEKSGGNDISLLMEDIINEYLSLSDIGCAEHATQTGDIGEQTNQTEIRDEVDESEELDSESEEFDSESEAVDTLLIKQSRRRVKYDIDDTNPHFLLGMTFKDASEARLAVRRYSVAKCTPLRIRPNDAQRLRVKCKTEGCPFHLYISKDGGTGAMMVRRIEGEHNCLRDANNYLGSAKFLATEFKEKIYANPKTSVKDIIFEAEKNMKLHVSKSKGKRAKKLVLNEMDGSFKVQFAYMGEYVASIKEQSPGTTVELEMCEESLKKSKFVFKRVFFCFAALKRGWRAGCRPIIGLDGCHLKGVIKGQVLVAVGKDGNEQLYPIAWAVIGAENKDNWSWFLELLVKELHIEDQGKNLTIVSDMQKGLVHAVSLVLPAAEHRYCARHVYANWSKKWHGKELKKRFWLCAWSSYKEEFEDNLKILGDISKPAAEDFLAYNPSTFCRAFFSSRSKSAMVDNNISESFNSSIEGARWKPIVSMLDDIRLNTMTRLASNKKLVDKWTSEWSPNCMQTYQDNLDKAFGCKLMFNGVTGYEIGDADDRHSVFLDRCLCTCRLWDLTGIPCSHAICALKHAKQDPKAFISKWYHKSSYMASYEHVIEVMAGKLVKESDRFEKLEPPPTKKLPGRPPKRRIRGSNEARKRKNVEIELGKATGRLPKKGLVIRCSICHSTGHNRAQCPNKNSQNSCITSRSNTQSEAKSQSVQAKVIRKNKRPTGLGILIDENSGNMILNPGFPSERLVTQNDAIANQTLISNPDANVKYPIPNERELRQSTQTSRGLRSTGSRKITFIGDGSNSIAVGQLPFKPPGLKWNGKGSITTTQLENEREKKKAMKGNTSKSWI